MPVDGGTTLSAPAGTMTVMPASSPPPGERAVVEQLLDHALIRVKVDLAEAMVLARLLSGHDSPVSPRVFASLLAVRLADLTAAAITGGWTPADLAQLVRRQADDRYLPALAGLVQAELGRHPANRVHPAWFGELDALGTPYALDLLHVFELENGLALGAVLTMLPTIAEVLPPPGRALPAATRPADAVDAQRLAKVRALLAKAESTEFLDEAEALSGKAQELISRYSLARLVHAPEATDIRVRRVWLDPPYLLAKAMLVDVVARANRCRTAVAESFGYVTLVGDPDDLEAVELIATSLLVQAGAAMLGPATRGREGGSRTASFRRAFLLAYASRIGERLSAVADEAVATSSRRDALVPVLRRRSEQVDAAFEATFPRMRKRRASYSNYDGWQAGRAAADQARLAPQQRLTGA